MVKYGLTVNLYMKTEAFDFTNIFFKIIVSYTLWLPLPLLEVLKQLYLIIFSITNPFKKHANLQVAFIH